MEEIPLIAAGMGPGNLDHLQLQLRESDGVISMVDVGLIISYAALSKSPDLKGGNSAKEDGTGVFCSCLPSKACTLSVNVVSIGSIS